MADPDLKFFIEGHQGHRGNVLAHVLYAKLGKLVSVLNQFDRKFAGASQRKTDYEIVEARKYNPTTLTLHPVPRAQNYDALPAFSWAFEEIEAVATGGVVDDRVDFTIAETLADLAEKEKEYDFQRMWIEVSGTTILLDETFRTNSLILAERLRAVVKPTVWRSGASLGTVAGYLSQVGDLDGEAKLVIIPKIGPERIACVVKDSDRDLVKSHLWSVVRISGLLHYNEKSPFPFSVDMERIEPILQSPVQKHLLDLRGIFKGKQRIPLTLNSVNHG